MSTPMTTKLDNLQSRLPDPAQFFPEVAAIAGAIFKAIQNGSIPQTTISLVQLRAGQIVGNTYHTVRQTGDLRKAGETEERITAVASWRDAPYFTDAERVALELLEAVLTRTRSVSASPTSCTPRHPPTTTTRRCGRSPWRSARSASSSPLRSSLSRSLVGPPGAITASSAQQANSESLQVYPVALGITGHQADPGGTAPPSGWWTAKCSTARSCSWTTRRPSPAPSLRLCEAW
jgi:carboxymuconolactone decarboxylase family protein